MFVWFFPRPPGGAPLPALPPLPPRVVSVACQGLLQSGQKQRTRQKRPLRSVCSTAFGVSTHPPGELPPVVFFSTVSRRTVLKNKTDSPYRSRLTLHPVFSVPAAIHYKRGRGEITKHHETNRKRFQSLNCNNVTVSRHLVISSVRIAFRALPPALQRPENHRPCRSTATAFGTPHFGRTGRPTLPPWVELPT